MIQLRRRGLFGPQMDPATPPIAGDPSAIPSAPANQAGSGQPSTLQTIAGVIGDTLSQIGGGQGTFLPQLAQRRQAEGEYAASQRQRADQFADWQRKQQWERDNPAPINNDTVNDFKFLSQQLGPEKATEYLDNMVANGGAAPQLMNVEGVGIVRVPRAAPTTGGSVPSEPPAGALDMLRKNPSLAPQFDQKYGPGASQRYLQGGPTSSASGSFR